MSANIEYQLICKIIEQQDFHTVEKLKIDESFFLSDSQTRDAFRLLWNHYHDNATYGSVPSWDLFTNRFHGFPWTPSYDSLPSLCQEVRRQKLRAQVLTLSDELAQRADADPVAALDSLKEAASKLTSEHEISSEMYLSNAYERLHDDYKLVASGQGITGIPWPWDILNEDTQGLHPGNFLVFYGRPKMGKTWIGLYVAAQAYMKGQRVLVYSLEMLETDILRRVAAILAGVDYKRFKSGKLDPGTEQRVWQILQFIRDEEYFRNGNHRAAFLAVHPTGQSSGVSTLQAKIREFQPDLVVVDAFYLMRDDRTRARSMEWKTIAHISQDLKQTATNFRIPIIGICQANRKADKDPQNADLMELAYADALGQDCDLALRVHKQKDKATQEWESVVTLPGSREGVLESFIINFQPATNFNFKRVTVQDPNASGGPQAASQPAPSASPGNRQGTRVGGQNPPPIAVNYRKKT